MRVLQCSITRAVVFLMLVSLVSFFIYAKNCKICVRITNLAIYLNTRFKHEIKHNAKNNKLASYGTGSRLLLTANFEVT